MSTERPNPAEHPPEDGRLNLNRIRRRADDLYVVRSEVITPGYTEEWQRLILPSPDDPEQIVDMSRLKPQVAYETVGDTRFVGFIHTADAKTSNTVDLYMVGMWPETDRIELLDMQPVSENEDRTVFQGQLAEHQRLMEAKELIERTYASAS